MSGTAVVPACRSSMRCAVWRRIRYAVCGTEIAYGSGWNGLEGLPPGRQLAYWPSTCCYRATHLLCDDRDSHSTLATLLRRCYAMSDTG
eukprot:3936164-Rhodomonas_salina.1